MMKTSMVLFDIDLELPEHSECFELRTRPQYSLTRRNYETEKGRECRVTLNDQRWYVTTAEKRRCSVSVP